MTSPSHAWSVGSLAALGLLLASVSPARAAEADPLVRWVPERSWPGACQTDVPTNGLVFLEGAAREAGGLGATAGGDGVLRVFVQRMDGETPLETLEGKVRYPDPTSAVFETDRPLAPNSDFQITAQRVSLDGTPLSAPFTSDFTTGSGVLPAPAFRAAPTVQLEAFDKDVERCESGRCVSTGQTVPTRYLRVAVPAIEGGLAQRPYSVSASLQTGAGNAARVVASADDATVEAGKRSYMVIEVPTLPSDTEGCVVVTARDLTGRTVQSTPVCTALSARPEDGLDGGEAAALQYAQPAGPAAELGTSMPADAAGGCSVGTRAGGAGSLAWLALALTFSRARLRKRAR